MLDVMASVGRPVVVLAVPFLGGALWGGCAARGSGGGQEQPEVGRVECHAEIGTARPPVRERELAEAFALDGGRPLYSICEPDLSPALTAIAGQIALRLGE